MNAAGSVQDEPRCSEIDGMASRREFIAGVVGGGLLGATAGRLLSATGGELPSKCLDVRDFGARGDGRNDDSKAVQAAIDQAVGLGTIVYCPAGEYPIGIEIGDGVQIICESGTIFRAAGPSSVVRITGDNTALWNVEVLGSHNGQQSSRGLAAHCIEVRGSNVHVANVRSGGARYDSLYIRAGHDIRLHGCSFGPTARNTCSIVKGADIWFQGCEFFQDRSTSSSEFNGLYLYDIEPEPPNEVVGVSHINCIFKTDLEHDYAGVILDSAANRAGEPDVSFYGCRFIRGDQIAPAIRIRNGNVYRGLTLVNNTFEGMVLINDKLIMLSDSILLKNQHLGRRFSYNVILDRVILVHHQATGWSGLRTTDATVRVGSS